MESFKKAEKEFSLRPLKVLQAETPIAFVELFKDVYKVNSLERHGISFQSKRRAVYFLVS